MTERVLPTGGAPQVVATVPKHIALLVDRAAMLFHSQGGLAQIVNFDWYHDGAVCAEPYFARLVWAHEEGAARLVVFAARTGDFVCKSLVGDWFTVDPNGWDHVVADDDEARCKCLGCNAPRVR